MTRQILQALLCAIVLSSTVAAQSIDSDRVAKTLDTLRLSVNHHDYAELEAFLDDEFTYQGLDSRMSQTVMQQVIAGYPNEILSIQVLSVIEAVDFWKLAVNLQTANDSDQRVVRLSKEYLLLQADIADIQLAGHAPVAAANETSRDLPAATVVPFTLVENLMVVKADINGVFGNYIVDTGAQAVVLNQPHFGPDDVTTVALNHAAPVGANGAAVDVLGANDLDLSWGEIKIEGLRGLVMDLTHLEANLSISIAGLIGYNVLERFQIQFDYAANELTLYTLDNNSRPIQPSKLGQPEQIIDIEMAAHIPVFPVTILGEELRMGLDSGAGGAMLFTRWQEQFEGQYDFIERTELSGADKNVKMGDVVRINNMRVQNIDYPNLTFRFNDIAPHDGRSMPMDGLLGYEFLQTRPTAINFRSGELLIWPTWD
jgi:hypothetical protein